MADFVMDWGQSQGHVGKTLKEMWHHHRGFVQWAVRKAADDPDFENKYAAFFDALSTARVTRRNSSGLLSLRDEYTVARWLKTKRCGCDVHSCCGDCEIGDDERSDEDEDEDEDEEEEDDDCISDCDKCGEPNTGHYEGRCWTCHIGGEKCTGCFVVLSETCTECGLYPRHKEGCEEEEQDSEEDSEDRCECEVFEDDDEDEYCSEDHRRPERTQTPPRRTTPHPAEQWFTDEEEDDSNDEEDDADPDTDDDAENDDAYSDSPRPPQKKRRRA